MPSVPPVPPSSRGAPPSSRGGPPSSRGGGRGSIKGTVLVSRLAFLRGQRGGNGVDAVIALLPEDDQHVLSSPILPFGWYSFDLYCRLDAAIAEVMGQGKNIFRVLGAASAKDNLTGDHRRFVQGRDPHALLRNSASIYKLYYDTGERIYERTGDRSALLRTTGGRAYSSSDCLTVVGWHEKAIEMCGGKDVRVTETVCRSRGGPSCDYVCEWQ